MNISKTHGAPFQQDLELARVSANDDFPALADDLFDIADDADVKVSELLTSDIEVLTVKQTARILAVEEQQVLALIQDKTLCCASEDAFGDPMLDAACVRAQAGVTQNAFLKKVRRLISTEKSMEALADVPQAVVEELICESETEVEHHSEALTIQSVNLLVENLAATTLKLEAMMYRAGYLEAKVENLEEQLNVVPDLRTKAAQRLILQHENGLLQATVDKRENELLELHQLLARLRQNWFCRSWCWLFGVKL